MDVPFIALVLLLLTAICFLLAFLGWQFTKINQSEFQIYCNHLKKVRRKRNQIKNHTEWQWPIWPRPLLFTEIDKAIQLALARTENAIEAIERLDEAIQVISPYASPFKEFINIKGNFERIAIYARNKRLFGQFYQKSNEIQDAEKVIRENRRKISLLKRDIEKTLELRKDSLSVKSLNLNYIHKLGKVRFEDVYHNILTAQDCLNNADLELSSAEQEDMVEWAAAFIFSESSDVSLLIFDYKSQCYSFSENYEADIVLSKLDEITGNLGAALSSLNSHSWKQLHDLYFILSGFKNELLNVEKDLADFEGAFRKMKDLIAQIKSINIEEFEKKIIAAERSLSVYFGDATSNLKFWKRNLSDQDIPSGHLKMVQGEYETQIQPTIEGTIILQSDLPSVIESLSWFLLEFRKMNRTVTRIEKLYQYHFQCEQEVHTRLSNNGETRTLIERTTNLADNSSREIKRASQESKKRFERCLVRANGPADEAFYPELLDEIKLLEKDLKGLLSQHETLISNLQADALDLHRKINTLRMDLLDLKQKPPIIERSWEADFQDFDRMNRQYEMTGNNYTLLIDFTSSGKAFVDEKNRLKRSIQQMQEKFFVLYEDNMRRISSALNLINRLIIDFKNEWGKPFSETIKLLESHHSVYIELRATLQSAPRSLPYAQAKAKCEEIKLRINDFERVKNETIEVAKRKKSELEKIDKEVNSFLVRRRDKNPSALADARQLIDSARQADNPEKAKEMLIKARGILENIANFVPTVIQYTDQRKEYSFFERVQNKVRTGDIKNVNRSKIMIGNKVNGKSRGNSRRRRN